MVYMDKSPAREYLAERGSTKTSTLEESAIDDQLHDALMQLDWVKEDLRRIDQAPSSILMGIFQGVERDIPKNDNGHDPVWRAHYSVLQKGLAIMELRNQTTKN
jgi:hypothetical protein